MAAGFLLAVMNVTVKTRQAAGLHELRPGSPRWWWAQKMSNTAENSLSMGFMLFYSSIVTSFMRFCGGHLLSLV